MLIADRLRPLRASDPAHPAPAGAQTESIHLDGARVGLWWTPTLLDPGQLAAARSVVDDPTAVRAAAMLRPQDTARILAAHALLRLVAGPLLGLAPAAVDVRRRCASCAATSHGRPYLAGPVGVPVPDVSLSHAGDLAVVALAAPGTRVGVDVEPRGSAPGWQQACRTVMGPGEIRVARAATDPDAAYLTAWTGKEAVTKATGLGLIDDVAALDLLGAPAVEDGWSWVGARRARVTHRWLTPPGIPGSVHRCAVAVIEDPADGSGGRAAARRGRRGG